MPEVQYVKIPYVEKPVSRIFFGTAGQPFMSGGDGNDLLDAILATGINAFDTARGYGMSEKSVGSNYAAFSRFYRIAVNNSGLKNN